ncbi:hypothetical protein F2Q69_00007612 [Brassica cretica]|uniref:Glycosyltransferase n=1 Tax=Brassica cretica TaxID=69181 RepID=A0A8S9NZI2_BRACR|nr:hypothetical protein F2Q69_00007612 [Brassica cretica]
MEKIAEKRRIVLVPFPAQGHITPMMQLGQALSFKGFSITVAQGEYNQVSSSQHFPTFQFVTIPESVPVSQKENLGLVEFLMKLNNNNEARFKDCVAELLLENGNDFACIIYDELMYFSEAAAKEFKIPSVILSTASATNHACGCVLSKLNAEKFLVDIEDPEVQDKVVENLDPLRYKNLPISGMGPLDRFLEICREVFNKRTASAVIINTASCLESSSLSWLKQELNIPVFPLGPLHITASANSSLLEEDRSCIEWLNKQVPRSVIYISLGSIAHMETKEVREMAWGLRNSNQPFLWVIRPGSIAGSESLPEEVSKTVSEKGYIVKWAPQKEVLGHPAVGGFWSHCGWNSTLESIVEGVPMICRPFKGEQKLNAIYVESVWRIGFQLQGEVERARVERAVKRLIVDEEVEGMWERALVLKEKLKASIRSGGSSYKALDELAKYFETE